MTSSLRPLIQSLFFFLFLWTFSRDIASSTVEERDGRQAWKVDPLTRKVFIHSLTAFLQPEEAIHLRRSFLDGEGLNDESSLSEDGKAVAALLSASSLAEAESALEHVPPQIRQAFSEISPLSYTQDLHAPLVVLLHDRGDQVIPIGESQRLCAALGQRPGVYFTEMQFSHLDPVKGKMPPLKLLREFFRFFSAVYRLFAHVFD